MCSMWPAHGEGQGPLRGDVLLLMQGLLQEEHPEGGVAAVQGGERVHDNQAGQEAVRSVQICQVYQVTLLLSFLPHL